MYNTKFILKNGKEIYPGYLDSEKRAAMKGMYGDAREYMRCGCRSDIQLYYRISEKLSIYPEHNDYKHDKNCSRYRTPDGKQERQTAYVVSEEDGEVTAYLKFNPKNLNVSEEEETDQCNDVSEEEEQEEENIEIEGESSESQPKEKKEPKLSLPSLIRCINVDTFSERVLSGKDVISKEQFSKLVYFRMSKVKINGMKKKLGELTLENDGVRFFYSPFAGCEIQEGKGVKKCYIKTVAPSGEIFRNFTFAEIYEKAYKDFVKRYGMEPNENTMISGFQYYMKPRKGIKYKLLGRIHLFQVSDCGLYARSELERETFDSILQMTKETKAVKFWIPAEDEGIGGIIESETVKKKTLILFRTNKKQVTSFDNEVYEPLIIGFDEPFIKENYLSKVERMEEDE